LSSLSDCKHVLSLSLGGVDREKREIPRHSMRFFLGRYISRNMTNVSPAAAIADPWRKAHPQDGARWLSAMVLPWWISGGWALDLFAGEQTREHKDLDIGVLRQDVSRAAPALIGWEVFEAKDGGLHHLPRGQTPRPEVNSLWCRRAGTREWVLELMLNDGDASSWIYRRDPSIRVPWSVAIRRNPQGIPYLAPEIQLLFKSRASRLEDTADFKWISPKLDRRARDWLRDSLAKNGPYHPWLRDLHLS
jgi:hypothetical protein